MYEFFQSLLGPEWGYLVAVVAHVLMIVIAILVALAFLLLFDRKVWAAVQMRKGPNVVGPFGLFQSFADFIKFVMKEPVLPASSDKFVFIFAPFFTFVLAMAAWAVIPVYDGWAVADIELGALYIFAISSLGVYGIIMGGWASNSKYPFLAALRSAAQMVSYEVSLGFVIVAVFLLAGTLNINDIATAQAGGFWNWYAWPLFPVFVIFFISALAETNRPPFDLPEADSELVAGYQVEYSSTLYLLYMIGEYTNIVLMCALMTLFFFGGWDAPLPIAPFIWIHGVFWFMAKVVFFFFLFAMAKAMVPRYRYDQLMRLGWKVFLPFVIGWILLQSIVMAIF